MSGKPTIPDSIHKKIRSLRKRGATYAEIEEELGVSRYTVRKAIDPDFVARERERQRAISPERVKQRSADPSYAEKRKARYFDNDEYRARVRTRMQAHRAREKAKLG